MIRRLLVIGLVATLALSAGCGGSSADGNGGNGGEPKGGAAPPPAKPQKNFTPNA